MRLGKSAVHPFAPILCFEAAEGARTWTRAQNDQVVIDAADAKRKIDARKAIVLDVVSPYAWSQLDRAIKDALRISPREISDRYRELPKERAIVAYCT